MPTPRKPAERRQNRVTRDIGVVSGVGNAPTMPRGLCPGAQRTWAAYWSDSVSVMVRASDTNLALRWIANVDRYLRLAAEADRSPMVTGSTGQPKAHPLYSLLLKFEASIREDERQLGIGPHNRLRLGVALSESKKSLADLDDEASDDGDDDPRATLGLVVEMPTPDESEG